MSNILTSDGVMTKLMKQRHDPMGLNEFASDGIRLDDYMFDP